MTARGGRIVHVVCTDAFAGVERYVADTARETAARGRDVIVIGGDPVRMRAALGERVTHLPGASLAAAIRALGRQRDVAVVHAHMTVAELAAALLARRLGARLVVTRHFATPRGRSIGGRFAARVIVRRVDLEVAVSAFVAASVAEPTRVLHNGVTPSVAPTSTSAGRDRTVLVLQRLEPEKDTTTALRAWALCGLGDDGWRLRVCGTGAEQARLRALASELGVGGSVEFAGFVDDPRRALARAAVLLAPAPAEPFGLAVVEAMAEATPVVAADGGAHRETLGDLGRFFPPGDAAAAGAALRAAVSSIGCDDVGVALARRSERFTLATHVDGLLALYGEVLDGEVLDGEVLDDGALGGGPAPPSSLGTVALLSVEPWDATWRRNQHLAARLVGSGAVRRLVFVEPPAGGLRLRAGRRPVHPGVVAITPPLVVPRRYGGHRVLRPWLRRAVAYAEVVWINDPVAGAAVVGAGGRAVYDVTDDWRAMPQPPRDRARIVAAEDRLVRTVPTVVCSDALAQRWQARYGVAAAVVRNGVDVAAIRTADPVRPCGPGPHVVYVGTLHPNRVDTALLAALARDLPGTLHLVGPAALPPPVRAALARHGADLHGAVPATEVPSWLVAADVLICPHLVDEFTLSLDAIKAHEYLATDRPVVATPTSGFQTLTAPGLTVVGASGFVDAVRAALATGPVERAAPADWDDRAAEFAAVLRNAGRPAGESSEPR